MKFLVVLACLISAVCASGYGYGHHIPARVDIAPGSVETVYTHKVVPQAIVTSYKTPIVAPVVAKYPIYGKTLHTTVEHYPVAHGYSHGGYGHGHGGKGLY